jgi:hypothetical protein
VVGIRSNDLAPQLALGQGSWTPQATELQRCNRLLDHFIGEELRDRCQLHLRLPPGLARREEDFEGLPLPLRRGRLEEELEGLAQGSDSARRHRRDSFRS